MTGHNNSIQTQTPTFLTTLQATLDILDDVSGAMPENTYLTLTNNLQELYTMYTLNSTSYANPPITIPINYISDISYASISNFDISNANNTINNNNNINNNNINNINNINNNYNENIQSRIQSLNEETNRMNYSTRTRLVLYNNVFNT